MGTVQVIVVGFVVLVTMISPNGALAILLGLLGGIPMIAEIRTMATMEAIQTSEVPSATDVRVCLEVLAWRAGLRGDAQVAARLFGAVEGMSVATGAWVPLIGAEYGRSRAVARSDLGDRRFAEAWSEGRRLSPEQALAYASGTLDEVLGR